MKRKRTKELKFRLIPNKMELSEEEALLERKKINEVYDIIFRKIAKNLSESKNELE